jgi:hypothetical protein
MGKLASVFRSDQLGHLRSVIQLSPVLREMFGDLLELQIVVDAEKIYGELYWRCKRIKPSARTALHEIISSGFMVPLAPVYLKSEIAKHLADIAAETGVTIERVKTEWEEVQRLLHFYQPRGCDPNGGDVDPNDLPYKHASKELGVPVYSKDAHFPRMKVPVISVCFDITAQNYVRAASVTLGFTVGSTVTVSIAVAGLQALWRIIKRLYSLVLRLPAPVRVALGGLLAAALIHPVSRQKLLSAVRTMYDGAAKLKPEVLFLIADALQEFSTAWATLEATAKEIRSSLPKPIKRSALMHLRVIIATSKQPLSLADLELQVKKQGYVSRARNLKTYLRRVLRGSGQFLEVAPGMWALPSS